MSGNPESHKSLVAENKDLRARLEKTEATLREILSGEADAMFVKGKSGGQLFALKSADQSYRILIENMSEGALTLTPDGVILYANRRFAGMLRMPLEKVIGSDIAAWFVSESRQLLQTMLRTEPVDKHSEEMTLAAADGTQVPVYLSVSRLHQDEMAGVLCMVATDLSEQKRTEAILADEQLAHAILHQAADAIVICDDAGRIIRASRQAQLFHGKDLVGQIFEHAFPLFQLDGTAFLPVGAVDTKHPQAVEATLTHTGREYHFLVSIGHLNDKNDKLIGSVVTLTDITERELVAATLLTSEAEFHTLAEAMPQIVWILQSDRRNIYFNQQWMDYTGFTFEESTEQGWGKAIHPDDRQRAWAVWQQAVKSRGVYSVESRLRRADGAYRWWLVRGVPRTDANGNILKWFGTCTDIHDIKMAQLETSRANSMLRESERRFSDLLNNVELVSMILDREGLITYCNDYLLHLTGWPRDEVIGKDWFELFIPPEEQDLAHKRFAAILADRPEARHHEKEILTRSVGRRLIRWNNSLLRSPDGDVIGTAHIGEDVTANKQAQREIELKNTVLQTQQDTSPDAILVVDEKQQIISYNQQFIDLWRLPVQIVDLGLDGPVLELVTGQLEDPETFLAGVKYLYANRDAKSREQLLLNDGRIIDRYTAPMSSADGKYYGRMWYFRDITKRVTSQVALQKSESQLSEALKIARIGYWEYEFSTDEFIFNDQYYSLHEITAEVAGGYRMCSVDFTRRYVHPDDASLVVQQIQQALENTRVDYSATLELRILTGDGETVWLEVRFKAERDAKGRASRVIGVAQDINERKRAEREIEFKNTMLQAQQDASPDAILVVDEQQRIVAHNQQFKSLWRIPPQLTVAGMDTPLLETVFDKVENPDGFFARVTDIYEHRDEKSHDEILLKDGRIIDRYTAPAIAADGNYYGRIWYFRDITERKRAEELLSESEQKQRAIFESANDGIMVAEIENGKLISGNRAVCNMLGYTLQELLLLAISDIHPEQDLRRVIGDFRKVARGEISVSTNIRMKRKDGSTFYVDISAGTLRVAGKSCVVGIFRDITERKRAQDAIYKLNEELEGKVLTRTAELERARFEADHANRAKSDFLAAMSHEIRTPMNGVIGMTEVLQQSSLNDVQMDMTKVIHDSTFALLNVINDILDFSKIEAGKVTLDAVPMSLTETIESVGDMFIHSAFNNDVSLRLFIDPALPQQVIGDAGRLRQILVNLVGNAIKFSSGQARAGKVSLRARQLVDTRKECWVEFSVTDNGIGMDQATQAKLFTPFAQASNSTATEFGGTGLGLVITQQLVHLKGGEIIVSSEAGKGTEVKVRVPFDQLLQRPDANRAGRPLVGLGCLIVDFKDGGGDDLTAYLAHAGAQPTQFADTDAARRWLRDCPAGEYVVVLQQAVAESVRADLRAIARSRSDLTMGCVAIGRGERRHSRVEADDLVTLDGDNLHFSELVRAVSVAAGRAPREIETQVTAQFGKQAAGQPSREMAIQQGRLILVVEDNKINQKVILHQLRLLGRTADVVDNGRQALEKWQSGDYSILLTDLNMPVMNGWDLSVAIRTAEGGEAHIPIVALTANALQGEADRCLEMGMDDYLSKPVQLANLKATLDKWLSLVGEDAPVGSKPHGTNMSAPVDVNVLKALVGNDKEIIRDFLHDFRLSATAIGRDLQVACAAGQAAVASGLMHKLKSSARAVGALALGELCAEMESAGKAGSNETLAALLPKFEQELNAVNRFIESLHGQSADHRDDK